MDDPPDKRRARADDDLIIRPNGLVERLDRPASAAPAAGYGSERAGRCGAAALRTASLADRRRRPRPALDPLKGRLIDLRT